jgi:hypothetical protein
MKLILKRSNLELGVQLGTHKLVVICMPNCNFFHKRRMLQEVCLNGPHVRGSLCLLAVGKDIVFRFIIEYSSLMGFGPR